MNRLKEAYNEITAETVIDECNHVHELQEVWLERGLEVNNHNSGDCTQEKTLASVDPIKSNIGTSAGAAPVDDEANFDAMVEELLEDLCVESESSELSESLSEEGEADE